MYKYTHTKNLPKTYKTYTIPPTSIIKLLQEHHFKQSKHEIYYFT